MADKAEGCPSEPLTYDALRRLNNQHLKHSRPPTPEEEHQCAICLETCPISHLTTLPCKHQFHAPCLRLWIYKPHDDRGEERNFYESQRRCPLCRRSLLYLCSHKISRHILRPGVEIDPLELGVPCPKWDTSSVFPHMESVASEDGETRDVQSVDIADFNIRHDMVHAEQQLSPAGEGEGSVVSQLEIELSLTDSSFGDNEDGIAFNHPPSPADSRSHSQPMSDAVVRPHQNFSRTRQQPQQLQVLQEYGIQV
ncbi:hypothetical protein F4818DRAFT_440440 [Hypoxylon cercidicola]|nr:hypothetical protein F4818DRAFT_440440 [Hypoxylon cercidicola]